MKLVLTEKTLKRYIKEINSDRHKAYFHVPDKYLHEVSDIKFCDLSDIKGGQAWQKISGFIQDRRVNNLNNEIKADRNTLKNPPPNPDGSPMSDAQITDLMNLIAQKEQKLNNITNKTFGFLGGALTAGFQNNLIQLLNVGSLIALGPASIFYCEIIKELVNVINNVLGIFVEKTKSEKREDEEGKGVEFDNIYRSLLSVHNKMASNYKRSDSQLRTFTGAIESLNLYPNEQIMAQVAFSPYIRKAEKKPIDVIYSAREAEIAKRRRDIIDVLKADRNGLRNALKQELEKCSDRESFVELFYSWYNAHTDLNPQMRDFSDLSDSLKFVEKLEKTQKKIYASLKEDMINRLLFRIDNTPAP